jgi:hypothetical protein
MPTFDRVTDEGLLGQLNAGPVTDPDLLRQLEEGPELTPSPLKSNAVTGGREILQGASFGFSDEIQSVVAAAVAAPFVTDKTFGALMIDARQSLRDESDQFRKENPATALGLNVGGGLLTGGAAVQGLKAAGVAVKGVKGALATGASLGAAGGAGVAEEGNRIKGALTGAAFGLLLGGSISGIAGGAKALWRKLAPGVQNRFAALAQASGLTAQQIATRLRALGPKAVIADVHEVFQRAADVAASRLGPTAKRVRELIRRDESQFSRLMVPIRNLLGGANRQAQTISELKAVRQQLASPLYEKAFAQPLQPTNRLKDLLSRPETQKAWRAVQKLGKSDPDVEVSLFSDGVDPNFKGWQAITEQLSDRIGGFMRAGKSKSAGIIIKLRKAVLEELDDQSPDYAEARSLWAGTKRADDMLEEGSKFFTRTTGQIKEAMSDMTEGDKTFFREGIGQVIEERLAKSADTADLSRLFKTPAFRAKAMAVFPTKETAVDFLNTVRAEATKKTTANLVGRGSQTQPRQVAEKQLSGRAIEPELTSKAGAARKAVGSVGAAREKTIQEIGELLLSQDPLDHQRAMKLLEAARKAQLSVGPVSAAGANIAGQRSGR